MTASSSKQIDLMPGERGVYEHGGKEIEFVAVAQFGCHDCFFNKLDSSCMGRKCTYPPRIFITVVEAVTRKLTT